MNRLKTSLIAWLILFAPASMAVDYTNRNNMTHVCELFADNAYQAASKFHKSVLLQDVLALMDSAPITDSQKQRVHQAIEFVWKNQLDNPVLASTLAMGQCLKPKQVMAPLDDPWITSPRTNQEFF